MDQSCPQRFQFLILVALLLGTAVSCVSLHRHEDPYLARAFRTLSSSPSDSATDLADQLRDEILRDERRYDINKDEIRELGDGGFAGIARLLRDDDPRVRSAAAFYLWRWNRPASTPFLIGLLRDTEEWHDAMGNAFSPARTVTHLLAMMYTCRSSDRQRVPVDETRLPDATGLAQQRWYSYHHPYCFIEPPTQLPRYYWYPMAVHFQVPAAEIQTYRASHPETFQCVPYVTLKASANVYAPGDAIPVSLTFSNYGTDTAWIRYDQTESSVHRFELHNEVGKAIPLRRHVLNPPPPQTGLRQPLYGDYAGGLGPWEFDLAQLFDIPGPAHFAFGTNMRRQ